MFKSILVDVLSTCFYMFSRVFNTCFYTLLAHIQELFRKGSKLKKKHSDKLQRKYFLNQKGFVYAMEKIRQRIKSKRGKLDRYNNRVNQYQQTRTFRNNRGKF